MLPHSCYLFHRGLSPGGFHHWCVDQTFLYNEPFVAIFHTVFGASRTVQKFIPLWSFVLLRGPQRVVPLCAWSNLVAVCRNNVSTPLQVNRDHTQGPRVYCHDVRVLYRVHLVTVRWSSVPNLDSSGSTSSLDPHYAPAHAAFVYAVEIVS